MLYDTCMDTINISLPKQLKLKSEKLVESGMYASFSDLVRDSLRDKLEKSKYDLWFQEAALERKAGKGTLIKPNQDLQKHLNKLAR